MKRSIIYDQKSTIGSKNRFLKTDQSNMIENRFLIGTTTVACQARFNALKCVCGFITAVLALHIPST